VTEAPEDLDRALASAAQDGDRAAFEALVRRYKTALYRFVRRYVGDADDAYDIVQEAFVSAWLAFKRFDPAQSFSTWLWAIALNKCRDYGRRRSVRRRILQLFAAETVRPIEREAPDADREADQQEIRRLYRLDQAIAQLPRLYKEPLLLTTVSGLTQQEAARQLKTTTKAIEMRIRRAKRRLVEVLSRGET
jgi:RNA polymerase sigma-70 factor (ECF subfamily)